MAQRPNSERNLYGPPKKLKLSTQRPSPTARGDICAPALMLFSDLPPKAGLLSQANDIKNQWAVIPGINKVKLTSPALSAQP